jgi:NADPH-dependent 2,4-dienoyl-CoA reductase/sulfur reductase-like enzyme/peroxiredoxin family protein/rhodanese-related sulfurtransferase/TusA-related sulfurtransferase
MTKYIIIGGVAGGATAAARLRRISEHAEIILIEKGPYISYANCGLPYYLGEIIKDRENLFVQTPEKFANELNIDVRINSEAIDINTVKREVSIQTKEGEVYQERYDKLLLSPGASPIYPPLEGIQSEGIFTLRNVIDTDKIKTYIDTHEVKNATIVGAGFIGLEMAENLHERGIKVSIVEMANQVMAPIDYDMATHLHQHLLDKGVELHLGKCVERFDKEGKTGPIHLQLSSNETLSTDLVILSIGVQPNTLLARKAGLKIGEAKGIWVDEYLQTSAENVYAVGDAIEFPHPISEKPYLNYLATPANRQGRIVADNMAMGHIHRYEGAIATSIAKVFDMTVASTGLPEKQLERIELEHSASTTHGFSHAGYYPDALPLSIKLTFNPITGELYGGQIIGFDGVDKRIDQLALLIKHKGTVIDLMELEQAYAPPFSSAKDPLAIAGYAANNIINGTMKVIHWHEFETLEKEEAVLIDVRSKEEFKLHHIENSINIPHTEIRKHIKELPKNKTIILICGTGLRSYLAQRVLMDYGFKDTYNLSGGLKTYFTATATYTSCVNTQNNIKEEIYPSCTPEKMIQIDACGLQCPGPILKVNEAMTKAETGETIEVISTDPAFARDAQAWCDSTGNHLLEQSSSAGKYKVLLKKGIKNNSSHSTPQTKAKGKTFILFSDDLDKAIATMILANGAAATGQKTTIFFTFWGLNMLKKEQIKGVKRNFMGKMFGLMLPKNSKKLKLSKMNMGGLGAKMIRYVMKKNNVDSLENLRQQALQQGVEFIACQMSMDVMGIQKEELLDEVTLGGVATYMQRADEANLNLFI